MTVHASKELLEAMLNSELPMLWRSDADDGEHARSTIRVCDGMFSPNEPLVAACSLDATEEGPRFDELDCADCLRLLRASLPEEALVRLDYLEERGGK